MKISQISAKINLRLNKGASDDHDNLWNYVKSEAFNKAVNDWVRRQYHGNNQRQEGDEETTIRVDDLQFLLKPDYFIGFRDKGIYVETNKLPIDYLYYKRVSPLVSKGSCTGVKISSQLREEANVDKLLPSFPSFDFEETFHTLINNKIHLYHNKDFTVDKIQLVYYRKPKVYDFKKLDDVTEFKDDVAEIITDEACKIIASDIESLNQKALAQQRAEENN